MNVFKRSLIWVCLLAVLIGLFSGCHFALKREVYDISWQQAFRSKDYPDGGMNNDQIAFAKGDVAPYTVDNLPRTDLETYENNGFLPRCSLFTDKYPQELELLVNCLSYALYNSYDRFILPMTQEFLDTLQAADRNFTSSFEGVIYDSSWSSSTELEDGTKLYYGYFHFGPSIGWSGSYTQFSAQHKAAFSRAEKLIASIPETAVTDYDKVLYLYQYLTDNVYYAYEDYYPGDEDYYDHCINAYYDTLVNHMTVCAGYGATFAWVCELAGIPAMSVTGQATETDAHLWTVAQVDGGWYWFDPTWDAQVDPWNYRYFGISDGEMEERGYRHLYSYYEEVLPACPEPLPLPSEHIDLTDTSVQLFRGTIDGQTYKNDSLGLTCTLPAGFTFLDDTEIGQGNGEAWTDLEQLLEENGTAYDMFAMTEDGNLVSVSVQRNAYVSGIGEEAFADISALNMEASYRAVGLEPIDPVCEKREFELLGETHWGISFTATVNGRRIHQLFVFYKIGNTFVMVDGESTRDLETCEGLLQLFSPA